MRDLFQVYAGNMIESSHDSPAPVLPLSDARPETLADQICGGTRFAVTFGGQGAAWWQNLQSLYAEQRNADTLGRLVTTSAALIAPVAAETMAALPAPSTPKVG